MAAEPITAMSVEEYLEFERTSETKHEYYGGEVLAMARASYDHNTIVGNVFAGLRAQLRGKPCRVNFSDIRVQIPDSRLFIYPDLTVVCGQPQFRDERRDVLLNPKVIIEILSPSTESHDQGKKFQHYRTIESLDEYVLIAQDAPRIEHFVRQANDRWLFSEAIGIDATLALPTIDCTLPLAEVYQEVEHPA
ncbi:MAG TPA: Uma2 family endonuclease [Thermomicrobiales bacterium]|jgi:Uma2 family endonuclease